MNKIRQLDEIADIVSGYGFPEKLQGRPAGDLPFFKVGDISAAWKAGERLLTKANNYITNKEAEQMRARAYPKGTIVFAKIGEAIKLNRRAILGQPSLIDNNVMGLIPKVNEIDKLYLFYFMLTVKLGDISQATTVPSVRKSDVKAIAVPVVPLKEQKVIVAELEKQFSRLDQAMAWLKRIKANLKRYKAAALKAAVEGKLTEEWRKAHPNVETGADLLKRILVERKKKWEEKNPGKKYKEPVAPDTSNLPELPKGWVWATMDQLSTDMANGFGKRSQANGLPCIVVRLADVVGGEISLATARHINCLDAEITKYALSDRDLLILRVNGSPDLVGRFIIVRPNITAQTLFCDHFIRLRTVKQMTSRWLRLYTDTKRFRRFIDHNKVSSAGQNTISQGTLAPFAFPLPPDAEQSKIIEEVESCLSVVEKMEATIEVHLKRAECLQQSILKKAFSGRIMTSL